MPTPPSVPLSGNVPPKPPEASPLGSWDGNDVVEVSVLLRPQPGGADLAERVARLRAQTPGARRHLSHAEFQNIYGPSQDDVEAVSDFANANNLQVGERSSITGAVTLRGRVADISRAFRVEIGAYESTGPDGQPLVFRYPNGTPKIPRWLGGVVEGITGLSTRPLARPHFVVGKEAIRPMPGAPVPTPASSREGFTASAIASAYGVPANASGKGQTIAIIELGGGYVARDMEFYCKTLGVPLPKITDVSVDGAKNSPTGGGSPATADGEVLLDMQVAAAVARSSNQQVYFAPNTEQGLINAVAQAVRDGVTSISISWGASEAEWSKSAMQAFDRACQAAIAMGIPVFAAAGDDGSTDGLRNGRSNADFPSSSPNVVACGGTELPKLDRNQETAWEKTGGAVSDVWPVPEYQKQVPLPPSVNDGQLRRTVPDLSANAAPATGYRIYINGKWHVFGGTSAVSPLLASMASLLTHRLQIPQPERRLGDFNALLYGKFLKGGALREINDGSSNGQYKTAPTYSAVTGLGTPNFAKMLQLTLAGFRGPQKPEVKAPTPPPQRPGPGRPDAGLGLG